MKRNLLSFYSSNFFTLLLLAILCFACTTKTEKTLINEDYKTKAYSYQQKADSLYSFNKLDSAFNAYLQSNYYFKAIGKVESITYNNLKIAAIYIAIGDSNSAQELLTKELPDIEKKDISFKVYVYNSLANCYSELEDYVYANKYYQLSLDLATSSEDKTIILNNIASNHIDTKEYDKAITILEDITGTNTNNNNVLEDARILNNLGRAKYKKDLTLGLSELQKALAFRLAHSNQEDIFKSYISLTDYYILNKEYTLAQQSAIKAYQTTINSKNKQQKLQALEYLIKSSSANSAKYYKEYLDLSKQISTENQQAKNQFAKIRYDFEQHEKENTKLKLDLQHSELMVTRRNNVLLVTFISLLLLGVIASFIYRKIKYRHRFEKIQQAYLTETKISKKIHDELANDVFNALTYTQNFNLEIPDSKNHLLADLESIYKKARNISLQHSSITTDGTFATHLTNLFNEYNTPSCQIIITGLDKFDFNHLDKNQKITIYRVIQELLVNIKKHSMATIVVFKFSEEHKYYKIFYSDNGVGIIQKDIISKNGLSNVENRITNIGGTFTFDKENSLGVKYNIQLPKKNYV